MISEEDFLGNEKNVRYLNKILEKGRVSHAYLFEGPEHVGKAALALLFAAELLGDNPGRILKNPDLLFIGPDKDGKQLEADTVRELQKSLALFPYKAKCKVAIIDKAELMNRTAANSLLKTLEEPGETSVLILISSDSGKLLDTIKSRCQSLNFNTVPDNALERFLSGRKKDVFVKDILELSQGKPGLAIRLCEDVEFLHDLQERKKNILQLFNQGNFKRLENAATVYPLRKEEVAGILDLWTAMLRSELLKNMDEKGSAKTKRIKNAVERIMSVKKDVLENNINLKLAIENLCLSF